MNTPWHMARVASRRELPKPRKMMGPVGERMDTTQVEGVHANSRAGKQCWYGTENGDSAVTACSGCGYHVCSCEPVEPKHRYMFPCFSLRDPADKPVDAKIHPSFERKACCGTLIKDFCGCKTGSVDVAGLEKLRAEWFTEYHLRKAAEREF